MEQFKQFNVKKHAALRGLEQLRAVLHELGEMGADVSSELQKVDSAVQVVKSDVLRIALLGASKSRSHSGISIGGRRGSVLIGNSHFVSPV